MNNMLSDHRLNDFGDFENKEWIKKQEHLRYVQKISEGKDLKVVSVYTGLFLELSFGVSRATVSPYVQVFDDVSFNNVIQPWCKSCSSSIHRMQFS